MEGASPSSVATRPLSPPSTDSTNQLVTVCNALFPLMYSRDCKFLTFLFIFFYGGVVNHTEINSNHYVSKTVRILVLLTVSVTSAWQHL